MQIEDENDNLEEPIYKLFKKSRVNIIESDDEEEPLSPVLSKKRCVSEEMQSKDDDEELEVPNAKPVKKIRLNVVESDEEEEEISKTNKNEIQKEINFPFESINKSNISKNKFLLKLIKNYNFFLI